MIDLEEEEFSDEEEDEEDLHEGESAREETTDVVEENANEHEATVKQENVEEPAGTNEEEVVNTDEATGKDEDESRAEATVEVPTEKEATATQSGEDHNKTFTDQDHDADKEEAAAAVTEGDDVKSESSPAEERPEPVDKLAESWKHMYPSVIYSLGFIPQDVEANHKKLSTLQIKSFIQAVAEASWDVIKDETKELSQVEFQALCETLGGERESS